MTTRLISTAAEPVSVAEAKLRLRIDGTDDDASVAMMISAARAVFEHHTDRAIALNTYELKIDAFPAGEIRLLWPPIVSVESVTYIDATGTTQTLAASAYSLDAHSEPGWLAPAYGTSWPETLSSMNAVTVRYTAGHGDACPASMKIGIMLKVARWYHDPEEMDRELIDLSKVY